MKKRFKYLSCLLAFLFSLILCFLLQGEHPIASDATQIQATGNRLQSRCLGAADTFKGSQQSDFYRTIIDNNLFRPLGWHPPRQKEIYRLLGTLIPADGNTPSQAILQSTTTKTIYVVNIGDTLDPDTIITNIQPKQVTLEKAGQKPRVLTLNPTLLRK